MFYVTAEKVSYCLYLIEASIIFLPMFIMEYTIFDKQIYTCIIRSIQDIKTLIYYNPDNSVNSFYY